MREGPEDRLEEVILAEDVMELEAEMEPCRLGDLAEFEMEERLEGVVVTEGVLLRVGDAELAGDRPFLRLNAS